MARVPGILFNISPILNNLISALVSVFLLSRHCFQIVVPNIDTERRDAILTIIPRSPRTLDQESVSAGIKNKKIPDFF